MCSGSQFKVSSLLVGISRLQEHEAVTRREQRMLPSTTMKMGLPMSISGQYTQALSAGLSLASVQFAQ